MIIQFILILGLYVDGQLSEDFIWCDVDYTRMLLWSDQINQFRSDVASGRILGQPSAVDMKFLVYDSTLQSEATNWANRCTKDQIQNLQVGIGQVIATIDMDTQVLLDGVDQNILLKQWFDQQKSFDAFNLSNMEKEADSEAYKVLMQAESNKIGCSISFCHNPLIEGKFIAYLTCLIRPYKITGQLYLSGTKCSQCSTKETCQCKYTGLCIEEELGDGIQKNPDLGCPKSSELSQESNQDQAGSSIDTIGSTNTNSFEVWFLHIIFITQTLLGFSLNIWITYFF